VGFAFLVSVCILGSAILALWRVPVLVWAIAAAIATVTLKIAALTPDGNPTAEFWSLPGWLPAIALLLFSLPIMRRLLIAGPAYSALKGVMPKLSSTESEALEAGTVGFDAELFSGKPDWSKLRAIPAMALTKEEQDFIDGPVDELCRMIDDWEIRAIKRDVPPEIWDFVKRKGFLGMLISKEHGGLGFSPQAQSLIVGKVTSRSPDVGVVVMVPNSLGPGELIEKFGTDKQKHHYLPRLARGEEVPCFALTGPWAGSDAASMRDTGIVCVGEYKGSQTIGIRLNWDKRYITLSSNATLLGLAFNLYDPDNLLGGGKERGITVALISTTEPGVRIGRRHLPVGNAFPNGPTQGKDVFVPLDAIVGGEERIGQGWRMLMSCLAAGRAIMLPATGTTAAKGALRMATAYGRIRRQFGLPIGRMEGIEEPIGRITEAAYLLESGRSVTASIVGRGEKPSVISAIMKYQATEWARRAVNDAMDIHGGKGICDGPSNYLQAAYQALPVSITVEGANILTRTLMIFGQGALRCHPYLLSEVKALQSEDRKAGVREFQRAFEAHLSFTISNMLGAPLHNLTGGFFAKAAPRAPLTKRWYKQLTRASRNYALVADLTVGLLGGGLKTRQRITGRLADALSEMYLLSCVLKRFEDDGQPREDVAFVNLCARNSLYRFYLALRDVINNFPNALFRILMRRMVFPLGFTFLPASDEDAKAAVRLVMEPGAVRDRLTRGLVVKDETNEIAIAMETAFVKSVETEPLVRKLDRAEREGKIKRAIGRDWLADACSQGIVTSEEAAKLREAEKYIAKIVAVDDFDPATITGIQAAGRNSRAAAPEAKKLEIQAAE
jgi:acyl-CoA dehydrogenase